MKKLTGAEKPRAEVRCSRAALFVFWTLLQHHDAVRLARPYAYARRHRDAMRLCAHRGRHGSDAKSDHLHFPVNRQRTNLATSLRKEVRLWRRTKAKSVLNHRDSIFAPSIACSILISMAPREKEKRPGKIAHQGGPDLVPWIYDTYIENLQLAKVEGGRRYHDFLASTNRDISSVLKRAQAFHIVKFGYPVRRAGYVVAVFSAQIYTTDTRSRRTETYYAYAYWPREGGNKEPEYICLGPTYDSRDGEYRNRFLWYPQFLAGYESLKEQLAPYEEALLSAIAADELILDVSLYPDTSDHLHGWVESSRLGITALAAALSLDAPRIATGRLDAHATPSYVSVVKALITLAPGTFGGDAPRWMTADGGRFYVFETGVEREPYRPQCGQKLEPLTVRESLQVGDVNFSPWREIWVGGRASDLVINGVAPNFSLYGSWTYLSGARPDLFENLPMRAKYTRSLLVEGVTRSLREARRTTARDTASYRLGQLDARVYAALLYAQDHLTLTDLALCSVGEYIGRTVATQGGDVAAAVRRGAAFSPAWQRMYAEPAIAIRYIFDFCYGAHVLHTRAGAIHSDLHLNNMTIFENRQFIGGNFQGEKIKYHKVVPDARIAYVAGGGESETYVFPHDGWFGCLIDFSRSLLGPAAREALVAERGEKYATQYYLTQNSRLLRVLQAYVPHFAKNHQEKLKAALLTDPDQVFRAATAVDFLAIGHNYASLLRGLASEGELKVSPEAIACAEAVEKHALQHLITYLTDLVETDASKAPCGTVPYAGESLIPAVFAPYLYARHNPSELRDVDLADVFVATAPLTYSGSAYDKFPPWATLEELSKRMSERPLGKPPLELVTADRGARPFLKAQDFDSYLAVLQEEVRRQFSDRPASPNSSWLSTPGT